MSPRHLVQQGKGDWKWNCIFLKRDLLHEEREINPRHSSLTLSAGAENKHSCWVLTHVKTFVFGGISHDHLRLLDGFRVTKFSKYIQGISGVKPICYDFLSHVIDESDASQDRGSFFQTACVWEWSEPEEMKKRQTKDWRDVWRFVTVGVKLDITANHHTHIHIPQIHTAINITCQ